MKVIVNPWIKNREGNCFGCSSVNSSGLKMSFLDAGDYIVSNWNPEKCFEGYSNILHGGIQSTMHDEIASWVVYLKAETVGMTTQINVKYFKSIFISGGEIKITARITEKNRKFIKIKTQLFDNNGDLCSEGLVEYRIFPHNVAVEKMGYPGIEAFYEN